MIDEGENGGAMEMEGVTLAVEAATETVEVDEKAVAAAVEVAAEVVEVDEKASEPQQKKARLEVATLNPRLPAPSPASTT